MYAGEYPEEKKFGLKRKNKQTKPSPLQKKGRNKGRFMKEEKGKRVRI